jgi:hypothetical protein
MTTMMMMCVCVVHSLGTLACDAPIPAPGQASGAVSAKIEAIADEICKLNLKEVPSRLRSGSAALQRTRGSQLPWVCRCPS